MVVMEFQSYRDKPHCSMHITPSACQIMQPHKSIFINLSHSKAHKTNYNNLRLNLIVAFYDYTYKLPQRKHFKLWPNLTIPSCFPACGSIWN